MTVGEIVYIVHYIAPKMKEDFCKIFLVNFYVIINVYKVIFHINTGSSYIGEF